MHKIRFLNKNSFLKNSFLRNFDFENLSKWTSILNLSKTFSKEKFILYRHVTDYFYERNVSTLIFLKLLICVKKYKLSSMIRIARKDNEIVFSRKVRSFLTESHNKSHDSALIVNEPWRLMDHYRWSPPNQQI